MRQFSRIVINALKTDGTPSTCPAEAPHRPPAPLRAGTVA